MEASAIHAPAGLGRISAAGPLLRVRSDDQLVALFRMGYDEAFRVIHDRYRQRLFAYTRQMLSGSRSDAEDVLQDVFLRAYRALRDDDRPVTLRAWLYRVAHNRCVDHLRRPVPPAAEVFQLSRTPLRDPLDEAERREDLRRLVQDVQRLPEQQRSALLMRELDGLSYTELADALRTTIPAVKSLLVRARIGLVEAGEARDTACAEIRAELASAQHRGVRASGRSRRHMRDCDGCRAYRRAMRGVHDGFAALSPGSGGGPLATLAKLLGIGGASSGAAAGATAGAGGSATVAGAGGSAAVVGGATAATKVVAIVCCAAVVGGGAAEVSTRVTSKRAHHAARHAAPRATMAAPRVTAAPPRAIDPLRERQARVAAPPRRKAAEHRAKAAPIVDPAAAIDPATTTGNGGAPASAAPEEVQTGGALAPDEPPAPASDAGPAAPADQATFDTGVATPAPGAPPTGSTAAQPTAASPAVEGAAAAPPGG